MRKFWILLLAGVLMTATLGFCSTTADEVEPIPSGYECTNQITGQKLYFEDKTISDKLDNSPVWSCKPIWSG